MIKPIYPIIKEHDDYLMIDNIQKLLFIGCLFLVVCCIKSNLHTRPNKIIRYPTF